MAELFTLPARATDTNADNLSGAKLKFYATGTSTPQNVYANATLVTSLGAVVTADSGGKFPAIYLDPALVYRAVLEPAGGGAAIYDLDPIGNTLAQQLSASGGSANIGFLQSGTGAVARTMQAKARDVLHAADFGVVGDGVTTDTTALQAAINAAASSNRRLILPSAVKTGALTIPAKLWMEPQGSTCTVTTVSGTYDTFTFSNSDAWIAGLTLENAAKTGGADFKFVCGTNTLKRLYIEDIVSRDSYGVFTDSGSGAGKYIDIALRRIHTERVRGPGVVMTRMFAYIILDDVSIDYTSSAADFQGFSFNGSGLGAADAGGLRLNDLNVLGSATTYTTGVLNQRGFNVANLRSIEATNCKADGCGELGWVFSSVADATITDCASAQCVGGLYLESCTEMRLNNWRTSGRNLGALAYKPANKDGVYFATGNDGIQFNGGIARDNTGHGINKSAAQTGGVLFSGFRSVFNVGRGLKSTGNSPLAFTSGGLGGNTAGNYDLAGNSDYIDCTQLNSGGMSGQLGPGPITG